MTSFFIQRLFSQYCSSSSLLRPPGGATQSSSNKAGRPVMDFAAFVRFVAAWEDREQPASLKYFFPLLDLQGRGYIDQAS